MIKKLAVLASAAALATAAHAGSVTIDDFSIAQGPISDTTVDGNAVVDTLAGVRTISISALAELAPLQNSVQVTGGSTGILDITNGVGDDSEVILTWNLGAFTFPSDATNYRFSALVIASDGNPTDVEFWLDGNLLLADAIPANTSMETIGFGIDPSLIAGGGELTLKINGAPGWDLALDTFGITYDERQQEVPEPATLALAGLALAGIGAARRRRKAA